MSIESIMDLLQKGTVTIRITFEPGKETKKPKNKLQEAPKVKLEPEQSMSKMRKNQGDFISHNELKNRRTYLTDQGTIVKIRKPKKGPIVFVGISPQNFNVMTSGLLDDRYRIKEEVDCPEKLKHARFPKFFSFPRLKK